MPEDEAEGDVLGFEGFWGCRLRLLGGRGQFSCDFVAEAEALSLGEVEQQAKIGGEFEVGIAIQHIHQAFATHEEAAGGEGWVEAQELLQVEGLKTLEGCGVV